MLDMLMHAMQCDDAAIRAQAAVVVRKLLGGIKVTQVDDITIDQLANLRADYNDAYGG